MSKRAFLIEYDSGIAAAERSMARKADTVTPIALRTGDDLITNRVTLQEYDDGRMASSAGALGLSATWACVNLLAGTIASLPVMVYRDRGGVRDLAKDHPLYRMLHDSPNADQTALDFWEFIQASVELHGNGFAEKQMIGSRLVSLNPIRPDVVTVKRLDSGDIGYSWVENGRRFDRRAADMLHIRGFGGGPLGGASTLSVCRSAFGAAQNVDRASSNMFRNGVRPSGVLSKEGSPFTAPQRKEAEQLLQEKFVGAMNDGRPMLLDNGLKWQQLTINPEDAQMLETRRFSVEEICRIFGVPPFMVGHTEKSTSWGSGLEQQMRMFYTLSLRRRLERIEQALMKQLLSPADLTAGVVIEFNIEGLLRGDSATRAGFYQSGLNNGWMTINEVRALENLPRVEGGDVPRMQMQNVPITEAGQQPAPAV